MNVNQMGFERRLIVVQQLLHGHGLQVGDQFCRAATALLLIGLSPPPPPQASNISNLAYDEQYQYPFNNYLFIVELEIPALTSTFPGTQPGTCKAPTDGVSVLLFKLSNLAARREQYQPRSE